LTEVFNLYCQGFCTEESVLLNEKIDQRGSMAALSQEELKAIHAYWPV
jgi:hypothetical protein